MTDTGASSDAEHGDPVVGGSATRRTQAWWVVAVLIVAGLGSAFVAAMCFGQASTELLPPPRPGKIEPFTVIDESMVAWGVTAAVCALAYLVAAGFALRRGLSTKSWLPLVCLLFPVVMAWWQAVNYWPPVA